MHAPVYTNGNLEYTEDRLPTGRITVWAPAPGELSIVTARIRIGDLEHEWEVGRVTEDETTFELIVPSEGHLTTLQQFAMSLLYVAIHRTLVDGEISEQLMEPLCVVWTLGFDEPPDFYTYDQAVHLWPGGVIGVEREPGTGAAQPADSVRAWIELNH